MKREDLHIKLYWPKNSVGLDISQITRVVDDYLHSYEHKQKTYDCGSGRHITIWRKYFKKPIQKKPSEICYYSSHR
jgi:hypothetical protein